MPVGEAAPQEESWWSSGPSSPSSISHPSQLHPPVMDQEARALHCGPSSKSHPHPRDHQPLTDLT